jgi:hypothetical protein
MEPVADEQGEGSAGANPGAVLEVLPGGRPGGLSVYEASRYRDDRGPCRMMCPGLSARVHRPSMYLCVPAAVFLRRSSHMPVPGPGQYLDDAAGTAGPVGAL